MELWNWWGVDIIQGILGKHLYLLENPNVKMYPSWFLISSEMLNREISLNFARSSWGLSENSVAPNPLNNSQFPHHFPHLITIWKGSSLIFRLTQLTMVDFHRRCQFVAVPLSRCFKRQIPTLTYIWSRPPSLHPPPMGLGPQVVAPIPFYLQAIGSISEVQRRIC